MLPKMQSNQNIYSIAIIESVVSLLEKNDEATINEAIHYFIMPAAKGNIHEIIMTTKYFLKRKYNSNISFE